MVILLSGASHTGKTRLAQQLMEHLHIPYLSIDHLKMGLIRSGQTTLTPTDDRQLTDYHGNFDLLKEGMIFRSPFAASARSFW